MKLRLAEIVDQGIVFFRKKHPKTRLTKAARTELVQSANKEREPVRLMLRKRQTTVPRLTKGLADLLEEAADLKRQQERARRRGRRRPAPRARRPLQITKPVIQEAMEEYCETFPWC